MRTHGNSILPAAFGRLTTAPAPCLSLSGLIGVNCDSVSVCSRSNRPASGHVPGRSVLQSPVTPEKWPFQLRTSPSPSRRAGREQTHCAAQAGPGSGVEIRRSVPPVKPCGQKSFPAALKPFRAGNRRVRAGKDRSVRPLFPPCGENSIRAGNWPLRASQPSVRAGENPSVQPFFVLCGHKPRFSWISA